MEARRVGEIAPTIVLIDLPGFSSLIEQIESDAFDARRVLGVDAKPLAHHAHGAITDVFVVDASEEVVEQTLTQCAARGFHPIDIERPKDRA